MEELVLMDAVERYLRDEMDSVERENFETLRKQKPELDQLVVEQQMFLQQLYHYGDRREFKHSLHQLHYQLMEQGDITETPLQAEGGATVVSLWKKYKRTVAVAASIAGITALTISGTLHMLSPKTSPSDLQKLGREIQQIKRDQQVQNNILKNVVNESKVPADAVLKSGGSSFLIDGNGFLVTNSHVVNGASTLLVVNKGKEYRARTVYNDIANDLAILKIDDQDWKPMANLPYSIRKNSVDLSEEIFTLGYPRNEVVYNRGYMSARSGYNDDTLSIQIAISANPGNSGGPLFDRNGDVIGILSTRDRQANEVVFASKASNINKAIEQLKKDSSNLNIKLTSSNSLKGVERVQQIKKIQDCVFMVKGY